MLPSVTTIFPAWPSLLSPRGKLVSWNWSGGSMMTISKSSLFLKRAWMSFWTHPSPKEPTRNSMVSIFCFTFYRVFYFTIVGDVLTLSCVCVAERDLATELGHQLDWQGGLENWLVHSANLCFYMFRVSSRDMDCVKKPFSLLWSRLLYYVLFPSLLLGIALFLYYGDQGKLFQCKLKIQCL